MRVIPIISDLAKPKPMTTLIRYQTTHKPIVRKTEQQLRQEIVQDMQEPTTQPRETAEYSDNPDLPEIEDVEIVTDFLPPPEVIVRRARQMSEPTNIVVLDPDIAEAFPNAEAVNQALPLLLELAKTSVHPVSS